RSVYPVSQPQLTTQGASMFRNVRPVHAFVLCALAFVPALVGCSGSPTTKSADKSDKSDKHEAKVTKENFDKVKKDMPKKDVEDLLGKGETKAAVKIGETSGDGVVYNGEKGKGEVIFKDDKVVASQWADK